MKAKLLLCFTLLSTAPLASAQEWDWSVTPYLWAAGIDGDVGLGPIQTDVSVDFSDLVDVLAGAALVHVEAQRDDHGFFGDLVYLALESDPEEASVGGRVEAEFDATIVELGYLRQTSRVGLELGVRYWDFELTLQPTTLPTAEGDNDWVDGFIGIRTSRELNDKWNFMTRANVGAGGTDFTYGIDLTFGREFESGSQFVFGLKLLDIDYEDSTASGTPFKLDTMFLGGTIGYLFD
jgi:hypothetical protein